MSIKKLIKILLDIEVNAEDILKLRDNPQEYVTNKDDAEKLQDLFLLMDLAGSQEVNEYGKY